MESIGDHNQSAWASTGQNNAQFGRTQDIEDQSTSKRKRVADDGDCQVMPIAKRTRSNRQPAKENTAAMIGPQHNDSTKRNGGVVDIASVQKRCVAPRSKKVRFDPLVKEFEITNSPQEEFAQDFAQGSGGSQILSATPRQPAAPKKTRAQKRKLVRTPTSVLAKRGRTGLSWHCCSKQNMFKSRSNAHPNGKKSPAAFMIVTDGEHTQPSLSQPRTPDGYFPILASSSPKEREWMRGEDICLLDAAKRREALSTMSTILARSEQACRDRVAHLVQVLQNQLAGHSTTLDEKLLAEIRQSTEQRSRASGEKPPSELERELWSDEKDEDDIMKLVIWKFYHGRGVLDPAMLETYETMREEMDTIESISPELLEAAAKIFIQRRAERHSQGA
ncbi:hypothetical protein MMC29_005564 [Sticta canariensis]|nr:hypothetical protein [Sticta canariensis]